MNQAVNVYHAFGHCPCSCRWPVEAQLLREGSVSPAFFRLTLRRDTFGFEVAVFDSSKYQHILAGNDFQTYCSFVELPGQGVTWALFSVHQKLTWSQGPGVMRRFFLSVNVRSICKHKVTYQRHVWVGATIKGTQELKSKNEEFLTTSGEILGYPSHPIVGQITDGWWWSFMWPCLTDRGSKDGILLWK